MFREANLLQFLMPGSSIDLLLEQLTSTKLGSSFKSSFVKLLLEQFISSNCDQLVTSKSLRIFSEQLTLVKLLLSFKINNSFSLFFEQSNSTNFLFLPKSNFSNSFLLHFNSSKLTLFSRLICFNSLLEQFSFLSLVFLLTSILVRSE